MLGTPVRAFAVMALAVGLASGAANAGDSDDRVDGDGPPAWVAKQWTGFPVRLVLADHDALRELLRAVPIASFHREQVRPEFGGSKSMRLVFEPRVTRDEYDALLAAGHDPERLRDRERANRRTTEELWAAMAAGKAAPATTAPLDYVPTNVQLGSMLQGIASDHPAIARYFTWGQSVQGRPLHGLVISDNVATDEAEPQVRYSSSMHGDEVVGMVLTVDLAYHLVEHYGQPGYEVVTDLVDSVELHLMPAHNPDGTAAGLRYNADGVDLNRNFPEPAGNDPVQAVENVAFMDHARANHFVLSLNYHGGALVMNYPWDYTYELAPDDDALIALSLEYSTRNQPMYNGAFPQGITNGAQWYVVGGSLQDWVYDQTDAIDVTCEVSNTKWPSGSSLPGFWDDNRDAMIAYALMARDGTIHGVVTDAAGNPLDATISLVGNAEPTRTDPSHGDYYKLADTGTYDVVVEAVGSITRTITDVAHTWGVGTTLDVVMQPLAMGDLAGVVTDPAGAGLEAEVVVRTWPTDVLVATTTSDAAAGGAFAFEIAHGDYTVTASAPGRFTESQRVTVSSTPADLVLVLDAAIVAWPIDEDFEAGTGVFSGDWVATTTGYQSDGALTDSEGTYTAGVSSITTVATSIDLTDAMDPQALFMAKWNIESSWDAVFFETSIDGGSSWTPQAAPGRTEPASGQGAQVPAGAPCFDGSQANWVPCAVDLSEFMGSSDVRVRFRLQSDGSIQYDGFHLDDFQVRVVTREGEVTAAGVPPLAASVGAFPNPFNPQTVVRLVNPREGHVDLAVYDLQGRTVRRLVSDWLEGGAHQVPWDGTDDGGRRVGSGTYLVRMVAGGEAVVAKLALVK